MERKDITAEKLKRAYAPFLPAVSLQKRRGKIPVACIQTAHRVPEKVKLTDTSSSSSGLITR